MKRALLFLTLSALAGGAGWFAAPGPGSSVAVAKAAVRAGSGKKAAPARKVPVSMAERLRRQLRWAEVSAEEIAVQAGALAKDPHVDEEVLVSAMTAWMEVDLPAALAAWRAGRRSRWAEGEMFDVVGIIDAARLPDFLAGLPGEVVCSILSDKGAVTLGQKWELFCRAVPQALRGGECEGAYELFYSPGAEGAALLVPQLLALPHSAWRDGLLVLIMEKAYTSPLESLAWARQCPQPVLRQTLSLRALKRLAEELGDGKSVALDEATRAELELRCGPVVNLPACLKDPSLLQGLEGEARARAEDALMKAAAEKGAVEGLAAVEKLAAGDPARRLELLKGMVSNLSAKEAFQLLDGLHDAAERRVVLDQHGSGLLNEDVDRLLKLLETEPEAGKLSSLFQRLGSSVEREKLTGWAMKLTDPVARRVALGGMIGDWSKDAPEEAAAFVAALPEAADRERLYWMFPLESHTTELLAKVAAGISAPEERRHFIAESFAMKDKGDYETGDPLIALGLKNDAAAMASDPNAQRAIGSAAGNLAEHDPAAAWEWTQTLPAGPLQEAGVVGIMYKWMSQSPEAASTWAGTLPAGPLRDAAAEEIVGRIIEEDPEAARAWIATMQSPAKRERWEKELRARK